MLVHCILLLTGLKCDAEMALHLVQLTGRRRDAEIALRFVQKPARPFLFLVKLIRVEITPDGMSHLGVV